MGDPIYYRTAIDIDVLGGLERFNRHDAVHLITRRVVDPIRLLEILPERGFAVRRFDEPEEYGGGPCKSAVAVRRMTAGEIRQRDEDAAALARHHKNSGPAAIQNLEN